MQYNWTSSRAMSVGTSTIIFLQGVLILNLLDKQNAFLIFSVGVQGEDSICSSLMFSNYGIVEPGHHPLCVSVLFASSTFKSGPVLWEHRKTRPPLTLTTSSRLVLNCTPPTLSQRLERRKVLKSPGHHGQGRQNLEPSKLPIRSESWKASWVEHGRGFPN